MDVQILILVLASLVALPVSSSSTIFSLSEGSLSAPQDSLLSPNEEFTAGFYSVGDNAYFFAIWFTKPLANGNNTVVWMANRDQPINGRKSHLSLLKSGNLVLIDANQINVWESGTQSSSSVELRLLDNGNLVLVTSEGQEIWQSFDSPTDTLLPEQPLTKTSKLVSRRSSTNFSSGFYQVHFNEDNVLHLVFDGIEMTSVFWPSPWLIVWDAGRSTYNDSKTAVLDRLGNFVSSDEFRFQSADYGVELRRRLTLDVDGNIRLYSLDMLSNTWRVTWQLFIAACRVHGVCGLNSLCSYDPYFGRKCSCIPGYRMRNPTDWSYGCEPEFAISCNDTSSMDFFPLHHVEFYGYDIAYFRNKTLQECKNLCLKHCDCKGFQYKFVGGNGTYGCYPKTLLFNGYVQSSWPDIVYVKLPKGRQTWEANYKGNLQCDNEKVMLDRAYKRKEEIDDEKLKEVTEEEEGKSFNDDTKVDEHDLDLEKSAQDTEQKGDSVDEDAGTEKIQEKEARREDNAEPKSKENTEEGKGDSNEEATDMNTNNSESREEDREKDQGKLSGVEGEENKDQEIEKEDKDVKENSDKESESDDGKEKETEGNIDAETDVKEEKVESEESGGEEISKNQSEEAVENESEKKSAESEESNEEKVKGYDESKEEKNEGDSRENDEVNKEKEENQNKNEESGSLGEDKVHDESDRTNEAATVENGKEESSLVKETSDSENMTGTEGDGNVALNNEEQSKKGEDELQDNKNKNEGSDESLKKSEADAGENKMIEQSSSADANAAGEASNGSNTEDNSNPVAGNNEATSQQTETGNAASETNQNENNSSDNSNAAAGTNEANEHQQGNENSASHTQNENNASDNSNPAAGNENNSSDDSNSAAETNEAQQQDNNSSASGTTQNENNAGEDSNSAEGTNEANKKQQENEKNLANEAASVGDGTQNISNEQQSEKSDSNTSANEESVTSSNSSESVVSVDQNGNSVTAGATEKSTGSGSDQNEANQKSDANSDPGSENKINPSNDNDETDTDQNKSTDTSSSNGNSDDSQQSQVESTNSAIPQEETEARTDLGTLPQTGTEGNSHEEAAAE